MIAATAGSVIGALALYWLGYALGEERLRRWLDHIPLVDADDLDTADRWFERHEKSRRAVRPDARRWCAA